LEYSKYRAEQQSNGIHFTSGQTGFAVGQQGTIIKTIDAGSTWTLLNSGTERNLNTLSFNKPIPILGDFGGKCHYIKNG
jgi:photosystem II stability/assembly factor-like uncharacterized protein